MLKKSRIKGRGCGNTVLLKVLLFDVYMQFIFCVCVCVCVCLASVLRRDVSVVHVEGRGRGRHPLMGTACHLMGWVMTMKPHLHQSQKTNPLSYPALVRRYV